MLFADVGGRVMGDWLGWRGDVMVLHDTSLQVAPCNHTKQGCHPRASRESDGITFLRVPD